MGRQDNTQHPVRFARLTGIAPLEIARHMSDPRVAEHMPLLTGAWDEETARDFVTAKENCWQRDGLGHWAFVQKGQYLGWGGFQKEANEWDFGLVLRPGCFGLGPAIAPQALAVARRPTLSGFFVGVRVLAIGCRRRGRAANALHAHGGYGNLSSG